MKCVILFCVLFNIIIWCEAGVIDTFIDTLEETAKSVGSYIQPPIVSANFGYHPYNHRHQPDHHHHHGGYHDENYDSGSGSQEHGRPYHERPYDNQPGQWHDNQYPNHMNNPNRPAQFPSYESHGDYGLNSRPPPPPSDDFDRPSHQRPPYQHPSYHQPSYQRPPYQDHVHRPNPDSNWFNDDSNNNPIGSDLYNTDENRFDSSVPSQPEGGISNKPFSNNPGLFDEKNTVKPPVIPIQTGNSGDNSDNFFQNNYENNGTPNGIFQPNGNIPVMSFPQVKPGNQNANIPGSNDALTNNGLFVVSGKDEPSNQGNNPFISDPSSKPNIINNNPTFSTERVNTPTTPTTTTELDFQLDIRFENATDADTNSTEAAEKNKSGPTGLDDRHLFDAEGCPEGKRPNNSGRCVNKF